MGHCPAPPAACTLTLGGHAGKPRAVQQRPLPGAGRRAPSAQPALNPRGRNPTLPRATPPCPRSPARGLGPLWPTYGPGAGSDKRDTFPTVAGRISQSDSFRGPVLGLERVANTRRSHSMRDAPRLASTRPRALDLMISSTPRTGLFGLGAYTARDRGERWKVLPYGLGPLGDLSLGQACGHVTSKGLSCAQYGLYSSWQQLLKRHQPWMRLTPAGKNKSLH